MEQTALSIPEQVKVALDGRTQRWLALQIRVPESDVSRKMTGLMDFTEDEIKNINELLKVNIKVA